METLFQLEDSAIGLIVSSTQWGYPIVLSLHAIGMAIIVGIALMLTARVLGFAAAIPVAAMAPYWRVAVGGFVLNLLSGSALFLGSASELFFNWAFRIKLVLVVLGLALTWRLVRICIARADGISSSHRNLAGAAVAAWIAAIISGRLIGYLA